MKDFVSNAEKMAQSKVVMQKQYEKALKEKVERVMATMLSVGRDYEETTLHYPEDKLEDPVAFCTQEFGPGGWSFKMNPSGVDRLCIKFGEFEKPKADPVSDKAWTIGCFTCIAVCAIVLAIIFLTAVRGT
jgi:hypothetical protein